MCDVGPVIISPVGWKDVLNVLQVASFENIEEFLYETSLALFENSPVSAAVSDYSVKKNETKRLLAKKALAHRVLS